MTEDIFLRLREFLNQFPLWFPQTPSGIEIKNLKSLYTAEEASKIAN